MDLLWFEALALQVLQVHLQRGAGQRDARHGIDGRQLLEQPARRHQFYADSPICNTTSQSRASSHLQTRACTCVVELRRRCASSATSVPHCTSYILRLSPHEATYLQTVTHLLVELRRRCASSTTSASHSILRSSAPSAAIIS